MNRTLHHSAFVVGLLALAWVGAGYVPHNPLALALVLLIGAFYVMGALELRRFHQATTGLAQRLATTTEAPAALAPWLALLHTSLQHPVRLRIEGERVALPGPALTPYLTGLLVLLGMLGTFLGMVATLKGTGLALETATDVDAIRASLSAPVKGLGLAFGTSVAGVAASAMLGLMSALTRRERLRTAQQLDACIATTLRGFSQAHQREESLRLQRAQAELLPALVTQLQGLIAQIEHQGQTQQAHLLASQTQFNTEVQRAYTGLADSVDHSLKTSLAESARLAAAAIEPAVQATMAGLGREATQLRDTLSAAVQQQLDGVSARLVSTTTTLAERWQVALTEQQAHSATATQHLHTHLEQHSTALLRSVAEAHAAWDTAAATREQQRLSAWHDSLGAMTATLQQQAQQDGAALAERQQRICTTLEATAQAITAQAEAHARSTLAEITQLMQAAAEAPRAAAEVIGELRSALSDSLVRDNAALDERNHLLATLGGLLDAVNHASTEQRAAIDALVQTSTELLAGAGTRFAEVIAAESGSLHGVATQVSDSAATVAGLGHGFGEAVQRFSHSNEQLMAQLQRIEAALGHSMARSDEQLAYYVAQAREIVDLTLGSQKQIVEDLQQLARPQPHTQPQPEASPA